VDPEQRIRATESRLFADGGLEPDEAFVEVTADRLRLRVLSAGSGPPLVFVHGVGLAAAIWAPWLSHFSGYRAHLVEWPGHGLSDPFTYRAGMVREHTLGLVDDLFDGLELDEAPVIAHSLGGMFALWHAAARPGRIASLVALGDPAIALPGAVARMPLSILSVPGIGEAFLRTPAPRPVFRRVLSDGLSPAAVANAPDDLVEVLRLAARRRRNAHTVASLMRAINRFRRPRPECVLSADERRRISAPTIFCWGTEDPFLKPADARPSIAEIPGAVLYEMQAGHGPWLDQPKICAGMALEHLSSTGFAPAGQAAAARQ
jgi:pimeloyl-ACP methyl ester carboxylesterase